MNKELPSNRVKSPTRQGWFIHLTLFTLLAGFASLTERRRPRVSLKLAVSLDGRLAIANGDSRWITSMASRAWVHRRRREADAILVGANTARRDNPALTTRLVRGHTPDRFVVDSKLTVRSTDGTMLT